MMSVDAKDVESMENAVEEEEENGDIVITDVYQNDMDDSAKYATIR